ncbi:MAG: hypothetical protein U9Q38_03525 [Thermodesulfobacteriota bacterium]|nr:hypothetical protein [Thermodesulfobacteriota bacterium]
MPVCTKCNIDKPVEEFSKRRDRPIGRRSDCKECESALRTAHYRSEEGVLSTIWSTQRRNCRERGHEYPTYSKEELGEWVVSHPEWERLYTNWVESGYDKQEKPSVDRLDDYTSYSMNNIRLVSYKDNREAYYKHSMDGTTTKALEAVVKINKETGEEMSRYFSIAEANRQHGKKQNNSDIVAVLNGRQKSCWGFKWERV